MATTDVAPKVLWLTASEEGVRISYNGTERYFGWLPSKSGRIFRAYGNPTKRKMPDAVFHEARRRAYEAVTDHALRDEMQLRERGELTDTRVKTFAAIVHRTMQKANICLTAANATLITQSALGVHATPGTVRAVATYLLQVPAYVPRRRSGPKKRLHQLDLLRQSS